MASWHYAFMFPAHESSLHPVGVVHELCRHNFEFDNFVRPAVAVDDVGHLDFGEAVNLKMPIIEDLCGRLEAGEQFLIECRNRDLVIACAFETKSFNPHLHLGWARNLFLHVPISTQQEYWRIIRSIAKASRASYVVLADDVGNLEDRFLEVSGRRLLDTHSEHRFGHGINALWVDEQVRDLPDGLTTEGGCKIGDNFIEYRVRS